MRKLLIAAAVLSISIISTVSADAQRRSKPGKVCGDPTAACKARENFQEFDLPFDQGKNYVIAESEWFYGIVLKSKKLADYGDCSKPTFADSERQEIQRRFPHNKVFLQNCVEPVASYYNGVADKTAFIGIYAGPTKAAAEKFLKEVKASGDFPGVRVRRLQVGINGT